MVVDPSGVTIASLGGEEGVLRTRIDLERLRGFREEFTAWREH
jgi:predicted amidohydrolase